MTNFEDKFLSIKLTRFFLRVIGFWKFESKRDKLILNIRLTFTVLALSFAIVVQGIDLYHCWGDFMAVAYNCCATTPVVVILIKLTIFLIQRDIIVDLIGFSENHIWNVGYDDFGKKIMKECEIKGFIRVFSFTFLISGTALAYLIAPLVENIGKTSSDRVLPSKIWFDLPVTETPYFEILFLIQGLAIIYTGISFLCFENLMFILTIHVIGQFKILQHKFENLCHKYSQFEDTEDKTILNDTQLKNETHENFKLCVQQHSELIKFVESLESIFTFSILCQMLLFSLMMCLNGFELYAVSWNLARRLLFIIHLASELLQLFLITSTCDEIIVESVKVGDAIYHSDWYAVPHKEGQSLKRGLSIVMSRAQAPCHLTAGKFVPVSLQAFSGILSTAMSYFTLARKMFENTVE